MGLQTRTLSVVRRIKEDASETEAWGWPHSRRSVNRLVVVIIVIVIIAPLHLQSRHFQASFLRIVTFDSPQLCSGRVLPVWDWTKSGLRVLCRVPAWIDKFWLPGVLCGERLGGRGWVPWEGVLPSVSKVCCGLKRKEVLVGVPGDLRGSAGKTLPPTMELFM